MASPEPIFEYYRPFSTAVNDTGHMLIGATTVVVDDASGFIVGCIAFVGSEQVKITAINTSTNTLTVLREQNGTTAAQHANNASISVGWIKAVTHADNSAVILCDISKTLNNPASAELILSNRSKDSSSTDTSKSTGALSDRTGERASIFEEFQDGRIIDNETGLVLFRGRIYHIRNQYDFQYGNTVKLVLKDMLQELVDIPIDNAPPALRAITLNTSGDRGGSTNRSGVIETIVTGLSSNFDMSDNTTASGTAAKFESSETPFTTEELSIATEDENGDSIWDIATGQQQALVLVNDFAKQDPHSDTRNFGFDYYVDANRTSSFLNVADSTVSLNYFKRSSRPATTIATHGVTLEYPSADWLGQNNFRKAMLTGSEFTNPNGVFFTSMVAHFEDTGEEDVTKRTIHGIESFELLRGNIPSNIVDTVEQNDFPWEGKRIQYIEDGEPVTDNATRRHLVTGQSLQTDNPNFLFVHSTYGDAADTDFNDSPCATVHYQSGVGADSYLILSNVYKVDTVWKDPSGEDVMFRAFPSNPDAGATVRLHMAKNQAHDGTASPYIIITKDARAIDRHGINKPNRTHIKELDNYDAIRKSIAAVLNRVSKETVTIGKALTARYPYTKVIAVHNLVVRGGSANDNVITFSTNAFKDAAGNGVTDPRLFGAKKGMVIAQLTNADGGNSAIVRYAYISAITSTTITYGTLTNGNDTSDGTALDDSKDMAIIVPTEPGHRVQLKNKLYGVEYDVIVQKITYTYSPGIISTTVEGVGINNNGAGAAAATSADMIGGDVVGGGDDRGYSVNIPKSTQKWILEDGVIAPHNGNHIKLTSNTGGTTVSLRTISDGKVHKIDVADTSANVTGYTYPYLEIGAADGDFGHANTAAEVHVIFFRTEGTIYKSRKLQAIAVKRTSGSGGKIWSEIQSAHDVILGTAIKDTGGGLCVLSTEGGAFGSGWPLDITAIGNNRMTNALLKKGAQPFATSVEFLPCAADGTASNANHTNAVYNAFRWVAGNISFGQSATDDTAIIAGSATGLTASTTYYAYYAIGADPSIISTTTDFKVPFGDDNVLLATVDIPAAPSPDYNTGTASQSGNTITGVDTVWTADMIGDVFTFTGGGGGGTITARATNTSITVSVAATVSLGNYTIVSGRSPTILPIAGKKLTISAVNMTANTIHADHLQALSITAEKIAAGAIEADKLEAALVLTSTIKTSATVGGNTGGNNEGLIISSAGIKGYDSAGGEPVYFLDASNGTISIGNAGPPGDDGTDAYVVRLSANKYVIPYDIDNAESTELTFTAAPQGIVGTATYLFQVDGVTKQAASTTDTYVMDDADEPASGATKLVKVTMYDNDVAKATDSVSIYGIQDGEDAITVVMTNEAHALPTTSAGAVTYTNSGTDIRVFRGSTALAYHASNASTFSIGTPDDIDITVGAASTFETNTRRYAVASSIAAATASITFPITVRNALGTATAFTKVQTLNKTTDGATGSKGDEGDPGDNGDDGENAYDVVMTNEAHAIPANSAGTPTSYANSGTDIKVSKAGTALAYGSGANTFSVTASASSITVDPSPTTVSTYTRQFENASNMTAPTASITFTITARNASSTATTFTKVQTFTKANAGTPGSDASVTYNNVHTVVPWLEPDWHGVKLDNQGFVHSTPKDSFYSSGTTLNSVGGWFLGYDAAHGANSPLPNDDTSTSARRAVFAIGTGTKRLTWDGKDLVIRGDITADTGTIGGWSTDANYIWSGTKKTSDGYSAGGTTFYNDGSIRAQKFYIDGSSGNAYFKGDISAATGTFAGSLNIGGTADERLNITTSGIFGYEDDELRFELRTDGTALRVHGPGGSQATAAFLLQNSDYVSYISAGATESDTRYDAHFHFFYNFGTAASPGYGVIKGLKWLELSKVTGNDNRINSNDDININTFYAADNIALAIASSSKVVIASNRVSIYEHLYTYENLYTDHILPNTDSAYSLGTSTNRYYKGWFDYLEARAALTISDLILNNTASEEPNMFDGTRGHWRIQEGADDLFIKNELTGKKYKFKLEEI